MAFFESIADLPWWSECAWVIRYASGCTEREFVVSTEKVNLLPALKTSEI